MTVDGRLLHAELMRLTEGTVTDVSQTRTHHHIDSVTLLAQVALYVPCQAVVTHEIETDLTRRISCLFQVVNFEDVVILRVRNGAEFCCNISGYMNLHIQRHSRNDPEEDYNCTNTCINSDAYTTVPKPRVELESRVQMRPTEGIFSFLKPAGHRTVLSRLFMIISRWSESGPSSSIKMKDAITAANIAGFI